MKEKRKKIKTKEQDASKVIEPEVLPAEQAEAGDIALSSEEPLSPEDVEAIEISSEVVSELPLAPAEEDNALTDTESLKYRRSRTETASSDSGVVPYDPLETYLREIRSYPPLSREEEREIAIRYYTNKDLEAAYKLVTSNLWLVVKIARDYERAARGILDLIQEGNIGLMEAVKNFDPYRGVRFPSYAAWWVKAYIVRYLIANWRLVKIGTTQAQRKLFFNLKKEKDKLEREGFYPGPKLLAEKLQVKESEVVEMEQRLGSSDVSVDAPLYADSEGNLLALLPASGESQEDLIDRKKMRELIEQGFSEFASTLKSNELIIFKERMLGEDKATLQDIAEKLSVSRERVRQIENRLKTKLKDFLETKFGSAVTSVLKEQF